MKSNQILSASLIDIIFDGRNKDYGAYELRRTYERRVKKALLLTLAVSFLAVTAVALTTSKKRISNYRMGPVVDLAAIPDEKKPEKLPEPERPKDPVPQKTVPFTEPIIKPENEVTNPMAEMAEVDSSVIGVTRVEGRREDSVESPPERIDRTGILDNKPKDDSPFIIVEVDAKFPGDWKRFLERNLNPEVPVAHEAPAGTYSVMIQFVVDREGNVSDIKALTAHGYGMEDEALRVIRKASRWEPAIQNGVKVKAYRKQVITFQVLSE